MKYLPQRRLQALAMPPALVRGIIGRIDPAVTHIRVKGDDDIRPAMRRIDIFILLGDRIRSFILDDEEKSVALQILQLELEPALRIRLGLRLYRAADPHHGVHRADISLIGGHDAGDLRRVVGLELIVQGDRKGDHRRDRGKDDLGPAKEVKYRSPGDHVLVIGKGESLKVPKITDEKKNKY
jgi:hypothetical protein